ncbi:thiazole tautomerase TenI [Evansella cellulosilytica]|uniref:Thiamine monophosphate synthase n=1 Tax=Evansella cellulosilytica (strain ATCC 21833 / DSM 2522 / FERM P-1141 / JCM 9156 / N-4) TaxID=649639 RepID=E6U039_EVAC2|nr:thiazole tautomerase TenI [Evansella cellulosilytica]ADU29043.1 thiamine monophosphate synthase [Evansella cellulosilytica DSM 2522]
MTRKEIHVISNGKQPLEEFAQCARLILSDVDYFHVREKQLSAKQLSDGIDILLQHGIPAEKIVVNDRVDVAAVRNVAGVQLAYHSLKVNEVKQRFPELKIGKSVHSIEEAIDAERLGADYVLYGHIFTSKSKPDVTPRGIRQLEALVNEVSIPVIAIGGITPFNVESVMSAGARGVAIMSGILEAEDPLSMIKLYKNGG